MRFIYRLLYLLQRLYWLAARPVILGVRVLLIQDGSVYLVKHTYQDQWFMPGGGVKRRETLEEAARREAREEIGAVLDDLVLVGMYFNHKHGKSDHIALFASTRFKVSGNPNPEIEEYRCFSLDKLPEDMGLEQRRRIDDYLQTHRSA